jgi:tetratricopeptide (TPR) repeat protein/ActR/RegA family two-component response regulator
MRLLGAFVAIDGNRATAVPLAGRSAVLARIAAAIGAADRGEGRVVIISGPAGMGKSTVLEAAILRAREQGFRIAEARAVPRDTPVPYDLLRDLIHSGDVPKDSSAPAARPSGLPRWLVPGDEAGVVTGFPAVAILPDVDTPVEKRILKLFDLERSLIHLGRRLLYAQLENVLLEGSRTQPVLLAVDDLHHTDRDSLDFLHAVAKESRERRVILVATLDSEASPEGARGALIDSLAKGAGVETIPLLGLSLAETAELVRATRPDPRPSPEYVRAVQERSQGVPATVQLLIRRYKESLPSVEKVAGESAMALSFRSVPEETQRILTYGAVIGRQFDLSVVARTLHRRSAEVLVPLLVPLVESGILRRLEKDRYEFTTPAVRQELYKKLPEGRRRLLHQHVARALEIGARPTGPELFEIAFHYHISGETVPSVDYNRRAADVAIRQYAYDEARVYLERALDSLWQLPSSRPESERVVRVALGHVLTRIGKVAEAIQTVEPLRDPTQTGPGAPSPLEQLFVPEVRPDLWAHATHALSVAERSLRAYRAKGELRWLAVAHRALGVAAWSLADSTAAEEHHTAAAELAHLSGDAQLEGQSLLDRAHLVRLLNPNGLVLSRRLLTDAIERFTASDDAEWLAKAYLDRSSVLRAMGRLPDALSDLTAAAAQASKSGSETLQIWVELRTARVLVEEGRTGRARKTLEHLRQLAGTNPRREVEQQISFMNGLLQEREGRGDKARAFFETSLALATEAGAPEEAAETHRRLAELDERLGRAEEARRHREEAERLSRKSPLGGSGTGSG